MDNSKLQNSLINAINEASPDGVLVVDEKGIIVSCNQRFFELWQIPAGHMRGTDSGLVIGAADSPVLAAVIEKVLDRQAFVARVQELYADPELRDHCEIALRDGRTIERHSSALRGDDGLYLGRVWYFRDITGHQQIEADLLMTQFVSDQAPDSIFWIDEQARIAYVNDAACRERGYTKAELLALSIPDIDPDFPAGVWPTHWQELQQQGNLIFETRHRRKDGSIFPIEVSANFVRFESKEFNVAFIRDITQRKAAEDEIRNLAFYDPLTHLPNRRLLMDRLGRAMATSARSGRRCALLFIDLDHFKTLNDTLGHDIGDMLLNQVAQRLQSCVREGDTVARLGGDEFVLILEDLSALAVEAATQTEVIGEKILATLSQPYQLAMHEHRSTPSIGATLFNGHQPTTDELMKQVDIAMYQSKKAGRNTLRFFDPQMQAAINTHAALEKDLRQALGKGQFQLHYQIQVDSAHHPLGAEVLIRWMHPERGLVQPLQFIPLAEETGLILPIGQWVLDTACAQIGKWYQEPRTRDLVLAINVSARQFHQADFAAQVRTAVQHYSIAPGRLKLELTESLLLEDIDRTISTMNDLNEIGVSLSLDDFGTGYSSLQYLKCLPLDQLKIDQSFVRDIAVDSSDKAIVKAIIAMADILGLDVIAEGVETDEQREMLLDDGCRSFQGYLFGRPVPLDEFERLLG